MIFLSTVGAPNPPNSIVQQLLVRQHRMALNRKPIRRLLKPFRHNLLGVDEALKSEISKHNKHSQYL